MTLLFSTEPMRNQELLKKLSEEKILSIGYMEG